MRFIRLLGFTLISLITGLAHAADPATQRLSDLLGQAQTMTARFSQLTLDGSGTRLQEGSGDLSLKRPGMFRWQTRPPMEQLLISNGDQIWLYDPDLEQVTIQKLDKRLTQTPALLLSGDISRIHENFSVSVTDGGSVVDFVLKPKAKDTLFDTLRLSFRNGVINDMQLIDGVGQRTNILFFDVKMNQPLADSQFVFTIPEGVDVIQE